MTFLKLPRKTTGKLSQAVGYTLFFIFAWGYFMWNVYSSGVNLHPIKIIVLRENKPISEGLTVTQFSPFGTDYNLSADTRGQWIAADNGVRPTVRITVDLPANQDPDAISFYYYIGYLNPLIEHISHSLSSDTRLLQFQPIEATVESSGQHTTTLKLHFPSKGSQFFSTYRSTINWKGDFSLFFWTFISAGMCLSLLVSFVWIARHVLHLKRSYPATSLRRFLKSVLKLLGIPQLPNRRKLIFGGVLVLAFLLRASVCGWGLQDVPPFGHHNVDEKFSVRVITEFPELKPTYYGTTLPNAIALFLRPTLGSIDALFGTSLQNYYVSSLVFRIINIILSTSIVWLVMVVLSRFSNQRTALIGGILISITPIHALNSAIAHVDIFMTLLIMAGLLAILWYNEQEKMKIGFYRCLGVLCGLLLGTKITALVFIFPLIASLAIIETRRHVITNFHSRTLLVSAVFQFFVAWIASYAAFNWNTLLAPGLHVEHMMTSVTEVSEVGRRTSYEGLQLYDWLIQQSKSFESVGYIVLIPLILAPFFVKGKNRWVVIGLEISILVYFLNFYLNKWPAPSRYFIQVAPLFCLGAACLLETFCRSRKKLPRYFGYALLSLSICGMGYFTAKNLAARIIDPRDEITKLLESDPETMEPVVLLFGPATPGFAMPFTDPSRVKTLDDWRDARTVVLSGPDMRAAQQRLESGTYVEIHDAETIAELPTDSQSLKVLSFVSSATRVKGSPWIKLGHFDPGRWTAMDFPSPDFYVFQRQ
ncbi:MAG: glycosyltransferase family 39 protein [Verrucomicrobiales bacterium]|nr:glycosyltransferase family 39 protein [Verrucomicrobiales bacterium]